MKKVTLFFALLSIATALKAQIQPTDTDGYYNISTLDHLRWVSENDSCWDWDFELDNDIDASDTQNWNVGDHDNDTSTVDSAMGWSPIGKDHINPFTGKFDGHGYAIDSLYLNRPEQDRIGFFGYTNEAQINNLGVSNGSIIGGTSVGGFIGVNYYSSITNSYSAGNVTGTKYIGGFAGSAYSCSITSCYSIGRVAGTDGSVGGFVFNNDKYFEYTNCFWDTETSGIDSSTAGTGKTLPK